jgi:hypothetical protein
MIKNANKLAKLFKKQENYCKFHTFFEEFKFYKDIFGILVIEIYSMCQH